MARVFLEMCISKSEALELDGDYDRILAQLVRMIDRPEQWLIRSRATR